MSRRAAKRGARKPYDVYWAVENSTLSTTQRLMLIALGFSMSRKNGHITSMTYEKLAPKARVGRRAIEINMKTLIAAGILVIVKGGAGQGARDRVYEIDLDAIPQDEQPPNDDRESDDGPPNDDRECDDEEQGPPPNDDRESAIVDRNTSDRRSGPIDLVFSGSVSGDRSIDGRPVSDLVAEALAVGLEVAKAVGLDLDGDQTAHEDRRRLSPADRRRISALAGPGVIKSGDLRAIGAWMVWEDQREQGLARSRGHRRFWANGKRCWAVLLANPAEFERRIRLGLFLEAQRAPVVDLPQREDELRREEPPDDDWWREMIAISPEMCEHPQCPPYLRERAPG